MSFCETVWSENSALYRSIVEMPFNQELRDGTLQPSAFRHYIIQDAHYLEGFARALALAAAKASSSDQIAMLASSAAGAIHVERGLHESYFQLFDISPAEFADTQPTPVCDHYVSSLIKIAVTEDFPTIVAALLPCFWIYMQVGKSIHRSSAPANPYKAWIDTYASAEFEEAVQRMITLADGLAASSSKNTVRAMHRAFTQCARLEWMFWDSAYHLRKWPV